MITNNNLNIDSNQHHEIKLRQQTLKQIKQQISFYQQHLSEALQINALLILKISQNIQHKHYILHNQEILNQLQKLPSSPNIKIQTNDSSQNNYAVKFQENDQNPPTGKNKKDDYVSEKNQTKNIPKNYGKAMLSFIQRNYSKYSSLIRPILRSSGLSINDLLKHIKVHKRQVNSIYYLKQMWGYKDEKNAIKKCIRIMSYLFMRKHCLPYIFNSRVKNYYNHVKYRQRIIQGINNPEQFNCIKQF